jgi:hypothetical protein
MTRNPVVRKGTRVRSGKRSIVAPHPRSVPVVVPEPEGAAADQPFQEGARDGIDLDLRHRLISEAAYALYASRGYVDGFDVEDWLTAEASVDHVLLEPTGERVRGLDS